MRHIQIMEAPVNLGLKEPSPGVEPGVRWLPQAMREAGFLESLGVTHSHRLIPPPYSMDIDPDSRVRNGAAIAEFSRTLAAAVENAVKNTYLPIVLGGDCSALVGSMLGLKALGNYGLFFMDGHTDYMQPEHSRTAGAAGMELAIVTGNGHSQLTNINKQLPYVSEENVWCYGNREYDPRYVAIIRQSRIPYFDLKTIRKRGIPAITSAFLNHMTSRKLNGFWLHLDVDVLDDAVMPCVDSRQPDGFTYDELAATLQPLIASPLLVGIEVTILDPTLDDEHRSYTRRFCRELTSLLAPLTH